MTPSNTPPAATDTATDPDPDAGAPALAQQREDVAGDHITGEEQARENRELDPPA